MKIFDVHTHAFPRRIAARSLEMIAGKAHVPYYHAGDFDALVQYERSGGADGFLILPIATKAASVRSINTWVAGKAGACGAVAFGTLYPGMEGYEAELDFLRQNGIRGIKLHPEYQAFFVDDERMYPMYEAVFRRDMVISFHAGEDLGYPPPVHGDAGRLARMMDDFPHGRIIAAHMGGLNQYDKVMECLAGRRNVWMDTSFVAHYMKAEDIVRLVRTHGSERILFGTDAPWAAFDDIKHAIESAGLTEDELRGIFWDNASELLMP